MSTGKHEGLCLREEFDGHVAMYRGGNRRPVKRWAFATDAEEDRCVTAANKKRVVHVECLQHARN